MTAAAPTSARQSRYWQIYHVRMAQKIISEFSHERMLHPTPTGPGTYLVTSDDGATEYHFAAELLNLDSWCVDDSSIRRIRNGETLPVNAINLMLDIRGTLGIAADAVAAYFEEFINTLGIGAGRADELRIAAADLAAADFQTIEQTMTEGHPCIVANAGRLGFDAEDIAAFAPESGNRFRLHWVAARSEYCDVATMSDVDYRVLLRRELGQHTLDEFDVTLRTNGLDPAEYRYLPVHPWQWREKATRLYATDIASQDIVFLGDGPDRYQPQQSIRTLFNIDAPENHYVKLSLSITNMGFTRGMSADYMRTTPLINDWVRRRVGGDAYLTSIGFEIIYEVAAIGYRSPVFAEITRPGSEYRKILSALWRESPVPRLAEGERLMTMAALLHVDHLGDAFVCALIESSGTDAHEWLRRFLRAYLRPITYLLYQYGLKFSPHGENIILIVADGIPVRAILKDIGEEVSIYGDATDLPEQCRRVVIDKPAETGNLGVLSDVFDDFLRPLASLLHSRKVLADSDFWRIVGDDVRDFTTTHPQLSERLSEWNLFAADFGAIHMNQLQLGNNRRMVDIEDSYASIIDKSHRLINPIAIVPITGTPDTGAQA
ncbi:MAG: IucA/IucC family protein [Gordonia sp. (in: high G+C Gram-positive bacteria)]